MTLKERFIKAYKAEPAVFNNIVAAALGIAVVLFPWLLPIKGALLGLIGLVTTFVTRMMVDAPLTAEAKQVQINQLKEILNELDTAPPAPPSTRVEGEY